MVQYGYGQVTPDGWMSFRDGLQKAPWSTIADLPVNTPQEREALISGPWLPTQKALLRIAIEPVLVALQGLDIPLDALDDAFDALEQELHFTLLLHERSRDRVKKAAAGRLRKSLMEGAGLSVTQLAYKDEVDFGRRQAEVAREPKVQQDIDALGLGGLVAEIHTATEALHQGLQAATSRGRVTSVKRALRSCARAFNGFHNQLDSHRDDLPAGPMRDQLDELRLSLSTFVQGF